ncbi:hypothetical protein DE146DRAFT_621363 [Phaeosphaeria sp. MPI-PUGE-AT-0046c]|nr:hypothetical protein DE146DRAFT_621363 [Phaeosphaeria sp. MPI-PUGE-AT-0046c]
MSTSSRQPRKWSLAEDQLLREEVEAQCAGSLMPYRDEITKTAERDGSILSLVVSRRDSGRKVRMHRSKGPASQDQLLIEATQQLGRHWKDIQREYFPDRSKNAIKNRYTVLVRQYQNRSMPLPSRPSSPSEFSTLAPPTHYSADEDSYYDPSSAYNNLMPPQTQGTSAGSRHSWSSLDSEGAVSPWSNAPSYLPVGHPTSSMPHTTQSISSYPYAQPQVQASDSWSWPSTTTSSIDPSYPMQAQSPTSYHVSAPHHYDDSPWGQPLMSPSGSRPYSRSPGRASYPGMQANAAPTSTPRAQTWSEQQSYGSLAQTTYPGARHQQNPLYRF